MCGSRSISTTRNSGLTPLFLIHSCIHAMAIISRESEVTLVDAGGPFSYYQSRAECLFGLTQLPYPRDHAWHCACMVLGKTFPMPSVPFPRSSYCILSRLDTIDRRVSTPLSLIRRTSRHQQQAEAIWMGTNSSLEATDADGRAYGWKAAKKS